MKNTWIVFALLALAALISISCLCFMGGLGALSFLTLKQEASLDPTPHSQYVVPTEAPSPPAIILPTDSASTTAASKTLEILENSEVPINDPIDLAVRLEGKQNLPVNLDFPTRQYTSGAQETFWVLDADTNQNFQVHATLRYISDHVYFWIEDSVDYNEKHLKKLVEAFEDQIYPTNREFFGSEWFPGVDADPHLYILYARGLGGSVAGYFSSVDEYLPVVREDSNGHEMFLLSSEHVDLDEEFAYGVLAHEFQHMIHWYRDRNEENWLNEGFSDLAMLLNGYSIGGHDRAYVRNPDLQLTDWLAGSADNTPHYGASFLFTAYFLDRFGEKATQALVNDTGNGMGSIDNVLAALDITDPLTDKLTQADDVFADWVIASLLQDASVEDGRYTYHNYPQAPRPSATDRFQSCPIEAVQRDVSQYGVDYLSFSCGGDYTLHFEANRQVGVLPEGAYSGDYAYYSNQGDESDMTLTRAFDFSDHSGPLTLTYWIWYDLEEDYDYLYLTASLDGESWQILTTPSGTPEDPSGNSYGWGYNGVSGGGNVPQWIQESVDISQFAGKRVHLRFEYITDEAVNGEGFLLDDVAAPETGYFTDFENDDGGWQAAGFVRIQNSLPQTLRLALISLGSGKTTIQKFELSGDNIVDIPLAFGDSVNEVILVVSGTTRFTRQKAIYQFSVQH
ncbi:MAG: immune inhibitor A [Anaerolineales bacterium]|nr:immune inhibitor A [Anaerolineales bacterium]